MSSEYLLPNVASLSLATSTGTPCALFTDKLNRRGQFTCRSIVKDSETR